MDADKDLHTLLERAAKLMVKAGHSAYAVNFKVAGKDRMYCFMESGVYMRLKRGTPPTGPGPRGATS